MQNASTAILKRARGRGTGWVFAASDFLDLGSRAAIDQALSRLTKAGRIRRVRRGLYDLPTQHARFGTLAPRSDGVAAAIVRGGALTVMPDGAAAANALGLTDQVPARPRVLTNGPARRVSVGARAITYARVAPSRLTGAGTVWRTVIEALRWLGPVESDRPRVSLVLRARLTVADRRDLVVKLRHAPTWMHPVLRRLAADPADG